MMKPVIKIFSSIEKLASHSAEFIREQTDEILSGGSYTVAVSGGSTPRAVYKFIADNFGNSINWHYIKIFFCDERCVPPDDNDSNYKMTDETLLKKINIPAENIFRIKGENDPFREAPSYSEVIKNNAQPKNGLPQFDLVMLGLGEDGHTASIFPDQIDKFYSKNICEVAIHPATGQKRITISGEVINNAKLAAFIVTGEKKSRIVSKILSGSAEKINYPASLVDPKKGKLIWMLDTAAANLLDSKIMQRGKVY